MAKHESDTKRFLPKDGKRLSKNGPVIDQAKAVKMYRKQKRHRIIGITFLILVLLLSISGYVLYRWLWPTYEEMQDNVYSILANMNEDSFRRAGNTVIYDTEGQVLGRIGNEKYEYVGINDISDYIQQGYIAKEDHNFTTHGGVDWIAFFRAGLAYVMNGGEITQGGSTITQQVVKNNLLTQEQTFTRKFTEIFLALQVEKDYTKAEIMEFYCNSNYYGNGCYGVEGASLYYFGKSADEVSLAEAAILVATSQSPNNYNPVANYELSMERKNLVLSDMYEEGYISEEEFDSARAEEPEIVQQSENLVNNNYLTSYALHCATLKLMELDGFQFLYTFDSADQYEAYEEEYTDAYNDAYEQVRSGGYAIYTSLNQAVQEELQNAIDDNLSDFTTQTDGIYDLQSAAVCIDNNTQMVIAIVGGREGEGEYNRGYQAERQPGSAIKPLLDYGPAINEGIATPGDIRVDEETEINGYSPENSDDSYRGEVTVREALVRSINTVAYQLFDEVGQDLAMAYLDALRFTSLTYADMSSPAVSIGGFTVGATVTDMARGYATLENRGQYSENTCILSLQDFSGDTIYEATEDTYEVYNVDTAFMITDMLEGTFADSYGFAHGLTDSEQHYAGKSGTTNNQMDAWFCGYSSYYTTAVWIGYDYPQSLGFYGSDYPLDIWIDFMDGLHEDLEPVEFTLPDTIRLINEDGELREVDYSTNIHASLPENYDYCSSLIISQMEAAEARRLEAEREEEAETAVEEFEAFQITSTDDARNLTEHYNDVCQLVNLVSDAVIRKDLMNRVAAKYDLLNGDVQGSWLDLFEEEEAAEQEQIQEENALAAQESLEQAAEELKDRRIEAVQTYIGYLNDRTLYTDYVETLISHAQEALSLCEGYEEYNQLNIDLNNAISYVNALPEPEEEPEEIEMIPPTDPNEKTESDSPTEPAIGTEE